MFQQKKKKKKKKILFIEGQIHMYSSVYFHFHATDLLKLFKMKLELSLLLQNI